MREGDRPAVGGLRAALEAEAFAGISTVLCLASLAGMAWLAQQAPAGMPRVARTLTTTGPSEVLRWAMVVGLGLRGRMLMDSTPRPSPAGPACLGEWVEPV